MDVSTARELVLPESLKILDAMPRYQEADVMSQASALRSQGVAPALAAALLTQSELRTKAAAKLGDRAATMLFTRATLEQATRWPVAELHAHRYLATGARHVADLTSGIGVDSLAFAAAGLTVTSRDIDEVSAVFAAHNLAQFPQVKASFGDGLALDFTGGSIDAIFADPARRTSTGVRTVDPRDYLPPLDSVWNLRSKVPSVGIKVGPGIPHHGLPHDAEVEWISLGGDVLEAGLWFGPLAIHGPGIGAVVGQNSPDGTLRTVRISGPEPTPRIVADVGSLGEYLAEPDGAVIRAHLIGVLAAEADARVLDSGIAYLTGSQPIARREGVSVAANYRVLDVFGFNLKKLKSYLRERSVGVLTIKKRGTAVVPEQLRKQLSLKGSASATIVLTRIRGAQQVIVVEPVSESQGIS